MENHKNFIKLNRSMPVIENRNNLFFMMKHDLNIKHLYEDTKKATIRHAEFRNVDCDITPMKLFATMCYNLAAGFWKIAKYNSCGASIRNTVLERSPQDTFDMFYMHIVPSYTAMLARSIENCRAAIEAGDRATALNILSTMQTTIANNVFSTPQEVKHYVDASLNYSKYFKFKKIKTGKRPRTENYLNPDISDYEIINTLKDSVLYVDNTPLVP